MALDCRAPLVHAQVTVASVRRHDELLCGLTIPTFATSTWYLSLEPRRIRDHGVARPVDVAHSVASTPLRLGSE